jgi:hypothetical protein
VKPEPAPAAEPASTASVSAAVPLPPPAPVRSIVARAPDAKPEKPTTRPAQVAARQPAQPVTPGPSEAAAPPADDRLEILGVKVPNGSDLKNAVSSIGEALNLPKVF